ncbi:MAG: flagellar biosynthesis anti-sigma factor FlgM [Planctomycetes bacterium]|nr:flagellar biosynthesis anti-sigma factor FlgM [Planctomycetota bacterium]
MDVGRTEGVHGPSRIEGKPVHPVKPPETAPTLPLDRLDISEVGRLVSEALSLSTLHAERLTELKRQIEAGTYQTHEKLTQAFENFIRENRESV